MTGGIVRLETYYKYIFTENVLRVCACTLAAAKRTKHFSNVTSKAMAGGLEKDDYYFGIEIFFFLRDRPNVSKSGGVRDQVFGLYIYIYLYTVY